ncbi:MAG: helix-turn-helix domain-containing protein, partial [Acidobacteriota bacterium]
MRHVSKHRSSLESVFSSELRRAISADGRSVNAVGQAAGYSRSYLGQLLRGRQDLKVQHVERVLEALRLDAADFLGQVRERWLEERPTAGIDLSREAFGSKRQPGAGPTGDPSDLREMIRTIVREEVRKELSRDAPGRWTARPPTGSADLDEAGAPTETSEVEHRAPDHRELARTHRRSRTPELAHFLAEESRRQCFTDVAQAVEVAELAVEVADALDPATHGRALVMDTRARALAFLGNAQRVAFDLHEADRTLEAAGHLLLEGSQDPLLRAEYLSLLASLRNYQTRYREALGPLEAARRIYEEAGLEPERGKTLLQMGCAAGDAGEHELGIGFLRQAVVLLDRSGDQRLAHFVRHNLAWFLVEGGEPLEALAWFEKGDAHYKPFANEPSARIRRRWLEGRIYAALDDGDVAVAALEDACNLAAERDLAYETASIILDLAVLHLEAGRPAEVRKLTERLAPVFQSRKLHGFALGALMLFRQAVETEDASVQLAR